MYIGRTLNEMVFHAIYFTEHAKAIGFQAFVCLFKTAPINREWD